MKVEQDVWGYRRRLLSSFPNRQQAMPDWSSLIAQVTPQVVKLHTVSRIGTGFIHYATKGGSRCIATAPHVLEPFQETPRLYIIHALGVHPITTPKEQAILLTPKSPLDSIGLAVIDHAMPKASVPTIKSEEKGLIKPGIEVGWLGYPALPVPITSPCFFRGCISAVDTEQNRYWVHGTSVAGVSGGPVFCLTPNGPRIIGTLVQHVPEDTERGLLPGLSVVVDVTHQEAIEDALRKLPKNRRRELSFSYESCPKCGAKLTFDWSREFGVDTVLCGGRCGPLVNLLDQSFVRSAPGGAAQLNARIYELFKSLPKT